MDSHSAVVRKDVMYVFGGFVSNGTGEYSNDIYSLDLKTMKWTLLAIKGKIPAPRANSGV